MPGSLGEKIGEGAFADVHAWAPGQVVKLFKPGIPRRIAQYEADITRAVFAAGAPAPEVLGTVTVEDRFGIVLQRLDGPTLLRLTRGGGITFAQAGAILAGVCMAAHKTPPPPDVVSLHDWMEGRLRRSGEAIPKHIATGVLTLIGRLRPGDGLCHVDLHPSNVIVTADGPRLIDWAGVIRAPAAFDLASCYVSHCEIAPQAVPDPQRPPAVHAAMLSEYARLAGASPAALTAAAEPYLPIYRLWVVLVGLVAPALREQLLVRIEAALDRPLP